MTGCAAGESISIKVLRDPADGADTLAAQANLWKVQLKFLRAM